MKAVPDKFLQVLGHMSVSLAITNLLLRTCVLGTRSPRFVASLIRHVLDSYFGTMTALSLCR